MDLIKTDINFSFPEIRAKVDPGRPGRKLLGGTLSLSILLYFFHEKLNGTLPTDP